jgi:hypothetical protein
MAIAPCLANAVWFSAAFSQFVIPPCDYVAPAVPNHMVGRASGAEVKGASPGLPPTLQSPRAYAEEGSDLVLRKQGPWWKVLGPSAKAFAKGPSINSPAH